MLSLVDELRAIGDPGLSQVKEDLHRLEAECRAKEEARKEREMALKEKNVALNAAAKKEETAMKKRDVALKEHELVNEQIEEVWKELNDATVADGHEEMLKTDSNRCAQREDELSILCGHVAAKPTDDS